MAEIKKKYRVKEGRSIIHGMNIIGPLKPLPDNFPSKLLDNLLNSTSKKGPAIELIPNDEIAKNNSGQIDTLKEQCEFIKTEIKRIKVDIEEVQKKLEETKKKYETATNKGHKTKLTKAGKELKESLNTKTEALKACEKNLVNKENKIKGLENVPDNE
jgi:predicted  nucleic acid-binding Zn-ribbon protein